MENVLPAIDWIFNSTNLLFSLIVSNWLLSAFLFVYILKLIVDLVNGVRNK